MAKSTSFIATLLLWGIVVIVLLNCILFFPWASVTHSATSDSIDRHEKLIASITDELNAVRTVTKELRAGNIGPFDKKVREALKGGSEEVQDYLNSPVFSEDAARRSDPQIKPDGPPNRHFEERNAGMTLSTAPPIKQQQPDKVREGQAIVTHLPPAPASFGKMTDNSVLVVGGTDGSGTRRVVEVLTQLGVSMVSEDPETYDIHADIVGGWPRIVDPVIAETHSLMYDPKSLSEKVRSETSKRVQIVLEQAERDSKRPESKILAKGGKLAGPEGIHATGVSFGIKAPVAMVMLPWWRHMSPNLKFLHVVRDGRDIAFSANQGPVNKFYKTMYPQAAQHQRSTNLKAIQLWSDWNSQIHEWSRIHAAQKNEHTFGYLLLHSEDLVDERIPVRFGAMKELAKWVQSDASDDYICCLAVKGSSFMGSHDRTIREKITSTSQNAAQLKQRYGKWKAQTQKNPKLADDLHEVGEQGLSLLGYEPLRSFPDEETAWGDHKYQCLLTPADCGIKEVLQIKTTRSCALQESTDYRGAGGLRIDISMTTTMCVQECCNECGRTSRCSYFTYDSANRYCYLKSGTGEIVTGLNVANLISGST